MHTSFEPILTVCRTICLLFWSTLTNKPAIRRFKCYQDVHVQHKIQQLARLFFITVYPPDKIIETPTWIQVSVRYFGCHALLWAAVPLLLYLGNNPPLKTHFYQYPETNRRTNFTAVEPWTGLDHCWNAHPLCHKCNNGATPESCLIFLKSSELESFSGQHSTYCLNDKWVVRQGFWSGSHWRQSYAGPASLTCPGL